MHNQFILTDTNGILIVQREKIQRISYINMFNHLYADYIESNNSSDATQQS